MRSACFSACRSEPQIPHASVFTSTSPGPGSGVAMSSTISCLLRITAARMAAPFECRIMQPDVAESEKRKAESRVHTSAGTIYVPLVAFRFPLLRVVARRVTHRLWSRYGDARAAVVDAYVRGAL